MIPKKILFSTDFSENSVPAGQCADEFAAVFGADLTIFHVIDCWAGFPGDPNDILNVVQNLEDSAKVQVEQLSSRLKQSLPISS